LKRCSRCDVVFHYEERTRCLYCDTLLMTVDHEAFDKKVNYYSMATAGFSIGRTLIDKLLGDRKAEEHGRMQFIIGSYFRSRTFHFMYAFSRNNYLMGQNYSRFLVQPIGLYSGLMLPWLIWDFIDTFIVRLLYHGYCEKCGWKYMKLTGRQEHDPEACNFKKEYAAIIEDVLTGRIAQSEEEFKQIASAKIKAGKKSAYQELCSPKNYMSWILDIACIWVSIVVVTVAVVSLVLPYASIGVQKLNN